MPNQKLGIIKLNKLNKTYNSFDKLGPVFPIRVLAIQERKNEHHRSLHIRIIGDIKFHLIQKFWIYGPIMLNKNIQV